MRHLQIISLISCFTTALFFNEAALAQSSLTPMNMTDAHQAQLCQDAKLVSIQLHDKNSIQFFLMGEPKAEIHFTPLNPQIKLENRPAEEE